MHPINENLFSSAANNRTIKIWSIKEQEVVECVQSTDDITAITFTPDGSQLVIGMSKGQIETWNLEDRKLKYANKIEVRNRRGKFKKGEAVTEIYPNCEKELLVTTMDERIRLLEKDTHVYCQKYKYIGHKNTALPLHATIKQDGMHIIAGSENGKVYLWNRRSNYIPSVSRGMPSASHNRSYETFAPFHSKEKVLFTFFMPDTLISKLNKYIESSFHQQLRIKCGMLVVGMMGSMASLYTEIV